jgi:hypothetical protein
MVGESFWDRLVTCAKGPFRQAAPLVSDIPNKIHAHVKGLASKAMEAIIN